MPSAHEVEDRRYDRLLSRRCRCDSCGRKAARLHARLQHLLPTMYPPGRPAPWMIFRCMEALGVYPPATVVKVGDTVIDIEDGRNAGCWSVGVIDSSNEMGLSAAEFAAACGIRERGAAEVVTKRFIEAGAHCAIDSLAELPGVIADFNTELAHGSRP